MKKTKHSKTILFSLLTATTILTGCVADNSYAPDVYRSSELRKAQHTTFGTILSMKSITIHDENNVSTSLLTLAGGAIGAIGGSHIGGGTGAIVSGIIGGVVGGMATNAVANSSTLTKSNGVEFTVQMDNGKILTFAQHGNIKNYRINQRVKIVTDSYSGNSRIDNQ